MAGGCVLSTLLLRFSISTMNYPSLSYLLKYTVLAIAMLCYGLASTLKAADSLFDKSNLAAWCIVPFDAKKRGPEERAAMLEKMGLKKFVYDYRAEHIVQWDEELDALKKHGVELVGWWFPTMLNDEAQKTLELFKRQGVKPQLWVSGNGGTVEVKDAADQAARVAKEVERLKPSALAGAEIGCQVGLYNHGAWYGEPENQLAIVEAMKAQGINNVGHHLQSAPRPQPPEPARRSAAETAATFAVF